jgi:hypothetical protein
MSADADAKEPPKPTLDEVISWVSGAGFRLEGKDGDIASFHITVEDYDEEPEYPLLNVIVSDDEVELFVYPELEMDFEHALEHNDSEFNGAAKLALDSDGDWIFGTVLRRQWLDQQYFVDTLTAFLDDTEDLIHGHGPGAGDDASEDDV